MDYFRLGSLEVSRVEETRTRFSAAEFYPDLPRDVPAQYAEWLAPYFDIEAHAFPCIFQSFVVRDGATTVLIDTCFGNDKERPDFLLATVSRAKARKRRQPFPALWRQPAVPPVPV